ncbi:MAG: hypothetical protein D6761_01470 [Candidatus Dadabacteria bacterium]|nr:MAG: hypothetical protein D6761_01470 [Candidatus Dadabacteria bacterium]
MRRPIAILCLLALTAAGCSSWERVSQTFPGAVGQGLPHEHATRDGRLYSNFETVGLVSATLLSNAFATALTSTIAREMPGRAITDIVGFAPGGTEATLLLILTAQHRDWRLVEPPDSPWSFFLSTEGEPRVFPKHIDTLRVPVGFERFFPAWNPWSAAALLTFPLPVSALDAPLQLHVQAVGGRQTTLRWP